MKAAQPTAAEQYAQLKEKQFEDFLEASFSAASLKGVKLFEVATPSGMKFKCRPLDGAFATFQGQMPMAIASHALTKSEGVEVDPEQEFDALSPIEQRAAIEMTAKMVRYICVSPRIVIGEVGNRRDAIAAAALSMADFKTLAEWGKGGEAASRLKTFRGRARR